MQKFYFLSKLHLSEIAATSHPLHVWALLALICDTEDYFPCGKSRGPRWQPTPPLFSLNKFLPEIKSACLTRRERVGERKAVVSVSTLHYVIGHKYLTVGIICKYFIKLCMSSPLVPHGPLLVRFTNDNINSLKKKSTRKRKKFNSHLKRIVDGGKGGVWENLIGVHKQQNSGGLCNEVWKVCSVFGGPGLLDLPERLSSKCTTRQKLS